MGLDTSEPTSQKQLQLQRMIRVYANGYLQDNLMGLQSLPTADQYEKIKERKKEEIQRKIEMEKRAALERARQKEQSGFEVESEKSHKRHGSRGFVQDQGWKPTEIMHGSSEDDPMVQQMNIIKGYIKQAKLADRWDEAQMLEENLKDLQREYFKQKQESSANVAKQRDQSEAASLASRHSGSKDVHRESERTLQEHTKGTVRARENSSQSHNPSPKKMPTTQGSPKKSLNPFDENFEEPKRKEHVPKRTINPFDNI